jgi:hypothetical protein
MPEGVPTENFVLFEVVVVTDDEEAVEHTERDHRHGKEVHRRDGFPVIPQEREPTFGSLRVSRRSSHPAGDGSLRDIESEHEELPVDARRSLGRVFGNHAEDQLSNFLRCWSSPSGLSNS